MVGTNTVVLAYVLVAILSVSNVDAVFKCYVCTGTTSSDSCSDPFTKSTSLESTLAICLGCIKTKINGVVSRECSPLAVGNWCTGSGDNAACYCESGLCNGSSTLAISMTTVLCAALAVVISKF
ncbi:uncharacterized protein LOC127840926 [Dreissena polymorpha]|uniref:Protein quiver n=1 Tax=Dreissena polymorpha TaxID=45954 RepID=A0A9D4ITJ4_DREPO|nr:uncharacterized protein LOC127840926 [Dreissena polymorpha]KAH3786125.1 hypothetical protein DPMN_164227 [Dreissena polymorpha]